MRPLLQAVAFALAPLVPAVGWADDATPGNADFVMLGEVRVTDLSPAVPTRFFKARLVAGRSYAASAWAPGVDPSETPVSLTVAWLREDGVTAAGGTDGTEREPVPDT